MYFEAERQSEKNGTGSEITDFVVGNDFCGNAFKRCFRNSVYTVGVSRVVTFCVHRVVK